MFSGSVCQEVLCHDNSPLKWNMLARSAGSYSLLLLLLQSVPWPQHRCPAYSSSFHLLLWIPLDVKITINCFIYCIHVEHHLWTLSLCIVACKCWNIKFISLVGWLISCLTCSWCFAFVLFFCLGGFFWGGGGLQPKDFIEVAFCLLSSVSFLALSLFLILESICDGKHRVHNNWHSDKQEQLHRIWTLS